MADDPIELFERLRPDDDPLTDAGREAIWARLVELPRAGESTGELEVGVEPVAIGRRRRVIAFAVAAALLLAVLMVATNRSSEFAERGRSGSGTDITATTASAALATSTSPSTAIASAKDPQLLTLPWLLDAMADRTGRVAAVLAPRVDGPPRELRPARRSPKLSIDDVAAALEAQVRPLLTPGVSVTIYLAELATAGDPAGEAAAAQLIYDVEISGVGCALSTATTAPPGATTAPVPCVVHLRVDADTGALLERWEQFSVG